jgi:hypothetical protein
MTTSLERSQLRSSDAALIATIERAVTELDGGLTALGYVRTAISNTSGGSSAALITTELSSWSGTKALLQTLISAAPALRTLQLGSGNTND